MKRLHRKQIKRYKELKAMTAHIDPFIERNLLYVTGYNGKDYLPYDDQLRKLKRVLTVNPN